MANNALVTTEDFSVITVTCKHFLSALSSLFAGLLQCLVSRFA